MKYLKHAIMIFLLATGVAAADPIEGLWRTAPDDHGDVGYIRISACDAAYCGRLERAENSAGQAITPDTIGTMIVWDLTPAANGTYEGRIYAPDRGKEYKSRLELATNQITVNGCVLGGLICRNGGEWVRVE